VIAVPAGTHFFSWTAPKIPVRAGFGEGHEFTRAVKFLNTIRASAPEVSLSLKPGRTDTLLKDHSQPLLRPMISRGHIKGHHSDDDFTIRVVRLVKGKAKV
jgi:hypothetical protein